MKPYRIPLSRLASFVLFATAFYGFQQHAYAQSQAELSSEQIFEEIVTYYDSGGIWAEFSGKIHMTSLRNGKLAEQDISLDNKTNVYTCIRNREDGLFIKGVENGKSFFEVKGEAMTADEIPEKYQKYPYSLSEHYAQSYKEHHTFHFSYPLALKAAGATPLEGVGEKYVFGAQCVSIKFAGYPDSYKNGYYNGAITLYAKPEQNFRLHAVHIDNGMGSAKEGMLVLLDGEMEIGGIKAPASKITFFDGGLKFLIADVFQVLSDNGNTDRN